MEKKLVDSRLRLMVFESAKDLGLKVDEHLLEMFHLKKNEYTFRLPIKERFFDDGHLKVELDDTVRAKDVFSLTDIGNYSLTYKMHGFDNHTSPNDLLIQLKDGIGACNNQVNSISIITPLAYSGRQHRKNTRENLLCGQILREFDKNRKAKNITMFDVHDQGVEHSLANCEFVNLMPSNVILEQFINDVPAENLRNMTFVAPDNGANGRRNVYLNSMNSPMVNMDAGSFYKVRDYNRIVEGINPIICHQYCGNENLESKTVVIVDDMISSGGSMLDCIKELKKRGAEKIYVIVTYALFTKGIDKFDEYYQKGLLDGVYTTNLSYIPEEYKEKEWLNVCDCSDMLANYIYHIYNDMPISCILRDKSTPQKILEKKLGSSC